MAVFDIIPTTGIVTGDDIRDTLAAGGGSVNDNALTWFKPEAKINRYSYKKPIRSLDEGKATFTDIDYFNSLVVNTYLVGSALPTNYVYAYNSPYVGYPLRWADFRGYMKGEYPELCDISEIPDIWDFDNYNKRIAIQKGNSDKELMNILARGTSSDISGRYFNNLMIIATKGSDTKYFLLTGSFMSNYELIAYIPSTPEIIKMFRDIGIQDYNCTALALFIPSTHPLYNNISFREIKPSDNFPAFMIHPEVFANNKTYSPIRKNFKITKPADRAFWNYKIVDAGNGRDMYIPRDAIYGARLSVKSSLGASDDLALVNVTGEYDRWTDRNGDFIRDAKYTSISGEFSIEYYNFGTALAPQIVKPIITSSPSVSVIDTGVDMRIEWNNIPISEMNSFEVRAYYLDPNYRPEEV